MGTLAYNPDRLAALRRRITGSTAALTAIRCADAEAATAMGTIRAARSEFDGEWRALVDRIITTRAMEDPLSLDPNDVRNALMLSMEEHGWALGDDPRNGAAPLTPEGAEALARWLNNDHRLATLDSAGELDYVSDALAQINASPTLAAAFHGAMHNAPDVLDALAGNELAAGKGFGGVLNRDEVQASRDAFDVFTVLIYGRGGDTEQVAADARRMTPYAGARLIAELDLDDATRGELSNDLLVTARESDSNDPSYGERRTADVLFDMLALGGLQSYLDVARSEHTLLLNQPPDMDDKSAKFRDQFNREVLDNELDDLETKARTEGLSDEEEAYRDTLLAVQRELHDFDRTLDTLTGQKVGGQLYIYEPHAFGGDGRAAVALGDLDSAEHVAFMVPGMGSSVAGMSSGRPINVYQESRAASDGADSVAVVDWMGYDAPSGDPADMVTQVANRDNAEAGAKLLADDVERLLDHRNGNVHITVIGNSYGSTTAAIAADVEGLLADDLILTGSPGAGDADDADDLTTAREHTWVGSASTDAVTYLGVTGWTDPSEVLTVDVPLTDIPLWQAPILFNPILGPFVGDALPDTELMGNDPAEDDFGANRFEAESVDRGAIPNAGDHGKYYDENSESLYNIGAIVVEEYDEVQLTAPRHDGLLETPPNPLDPFGQLAPADPEYVRQPGAPTHRR
jgi:Alpha/beta hydrolase